MRYTDIFAMSLISQYLFLLVLFFPTPYETLILHLRVVMWILVISKATHGCCSPHSCY